MPKTKAFFASECIRQDGEVAFTMVSVDSAMIPTDVTLAVSDLGHSLSSWDAFPRKIGERDKASALMFPFPGTQRTVKLLSAILSRTGSGQSVVKFGQ